MEGLNQWMGVGNLGADPELRIAQSGSAVLKLRLACGESFLDGNDQWQERTEWVSVTMFGKRAEGLAKILHKGDRLCVVGRLSTSTYEKDGEKRYRTEIIASKVVLAGGGQREDHEGDAGRRSAPRTAPRAAAAGGGGRGRAPQPASDFDEDGGFGLSDEIPFIHPFGLGRGRP